jgi:hypothetical protein
MTKEDVIEALQDLIIEEQVRKKSDMHMYIDALTLAISILEKIDEEKIEKIIGDWVYENRLQENKDKGRAIRIKDLARAIVQSLGGE